MSVALVGTKVVKEAVKGLETLVETVMAPVVEVEAKKSNGVTTEAVVGPEGEVEALVSPEAVENMVGTDAENEPVVLSETVGKTVKVSDTVMLFVGGREKVEISVVNGEAEKGFVVGLMVSEPVLEAAGIGDDAVDMTVNSEDVSQAVEVTGAIVDNEVN